MADLQGDAIRYLAFRLVSSGKTTTLRTLTDDAVKTSEIEGERLDTVQVRSSVARRLGIALARFVPQDRHVDGLVEVLLDAIAHLWFVTLHPFEDGNGRLARAIACLALARSEGSAQRFYSLSAQIRQDRRSYYEHLERTQKGALDITAWLAWFLACLGRSLAAAAGAQLAAGWAGWEADVLALGEAGRVFAGHGVAGYSGVGAGRVVAAGGDGGKEYLLCAPGDRLTPRTPAADHSSFTPRTAADQTETGAARRSPEWRRTADAPG